MTEKTGTSAIDGAVLDGIRALEGPGGQGLLEKVLAIYLSDSMKLVERMRFSAEAGDAETLHRTAHTLKSSSANVGATGLSDICRKIEGETIDGNPLAGVGPLLGKLEEEYRSVRRELEAVLAAARGGTAKG